MRLWVQPERLVAVGRHPVARAVADVQKAVDNHLELAAVEAFGLLLPGVVRRACAVVGGDDHQHVSILDLCEEEGQEVGQIAVQPVVHVLDLDRLGTVGLGDAARRVEADVQQIGRPVGAQTVLGDSLFGQPQHGGIPGRRVEQPFVVACQFQTPLSVGVLLFVAAQEDDVVLTGVQIATLSSSDRHSRPM